MSEESEPSPRASGPQDAASDYDLYSWAASLGVSLGELRRVIAEVGDSAVAVRRRLAER